MKDGDLFRWYYNNEIEYRQKHAGSGTAYWCMDSAENVTADNVK